MQIPLLCALYRQESQAWGKAGPEFEARQCLFSALWDPGKRRNLREGTRFLVCTATIIGALTSRM